MSRKTREEIEALCKKHNVSRIWSWSRFNTYHNSPYEYFLKHIKHVHEDRQDCIYVVTGGMAHDIMEKLYLNKIRYSEMDELFEDAWLMANISELKFDRNDSDKNKKISEKYYNNLKHFFNNHKMIQHKMDIERFITIKVGEHLFQGYIDACYKDNDGSYHILDWKTSSIYRGEKAINESGQLVLYAMGLHQLGVPYEKIKPEWDFVKYVKVECEQANGVWKERIIDRCEVGEKLQTNVKMWLKKLGYEDNLMEYLDMLIQTNDISCLPEDVQSKYRFYDCIVGIDLTEELINKWEADITTTLAEIIQKESEYQNIKIVDEDEAEKIFFDTEEQVEKQSYYFSTLCAYSPNLHKPYKVYLDKLEKAKNGSVFGGLNNGDSSSDYDSEEDMSWLNEL